MMVKISKKKILNFENTIQLEIYDKDTDLIQYFEK